MASGEPTRAASRTPTGRRAPPPAAGGANSMRTASGVSRASRAAAATRAGLTRALADPPPALRRAAALTLAALVATMLLLGTRPGAGAYIPQPPLDKLLHAVVFGGYGVIAWVALGSRRAWLAVALATTIGLADEFLQSLTPGRVASLRDLAADFGGALLAVAIAVWLRRRVTAAPPAPQRRTLG